MIAASLLPTPTKAADICDTFSHNDSLTIFDQPAANVMMDFDTTSHSICYSFTSNVKDLDIIPAHFCVNINDAETPPVWLRFKDGKDYEVTDVYTPNMTLQYYNLRECLNNGVHL